MIADSFVGSFIFAFTVWRVINQCRIYASADIEFAVPHDFVANVAARSASRFLKLPRIGGKRTRIITICGIL